MIPTMASGNSIFVLTPPFSPYFLVLVGRRYVGHTSKNNQEKSKKMFQEQRKVGKARIFPPIYEQLTWCSVLLRRMKVGSYSAAEETVRLYLIAFPLPILDLPFPFPLPVFPPVLVPGPPPPLSSPVTRLSPDPPRMDAEDEALMARLLESFTSPTSWRISSRNSSGSGCEKDERDDVEAERVAGERQVEE